MPDSASPITMMKSVRTFMKVGSCSETTCNLVNRAYGAPLEAEENAAMPFAGGIMQHGYQCGLLWGAVLAAGAEAHRRFGPGPRAEAAAVHAATRLVETFRNRFGEVNCLELIETDWHKTGQVVKYFLKGGSFRCFHMAGVYSRLAFDVIEESLAEDIPVPSAPVSCAAELARRLGATEQQTVMAAGLAGGIGLSGGACGAMGAAIWLLALRSRSEQDGKLDYKDPRLETLVEAYLASADYRFECEEVVGRRFTGAADHAAHCAGGGCAEILDTLAAQHTAA